MSKSSIRSSIHPTTKKHARGRIHFTKEAPQSLGLLSRMFQSASKMKSVALLSIGIACSTWFHLGAAQAGAIREVYVTQSALSCRVGENIQFDAEAQTVLGSRPKVTASASWASSEESMVKPIGSGLFQCLAVGDVTITVSYQGKTKRIDLHVDPAIIMVEEQKKEEPPPPPPPPPEPLPQPETPPPPPPPNAKPPEPKPYEPPPPAAAKAGNLLAADEKSEQKSDMPSFVTDPNGEEYGSGTVMKGGTADKAGPGPVTTSSVTGTGTTKSTATAPPPPPPPPPPSPKVNLSRKARLPNGGNACRNYFPGEADDDNGLVQLSATIEASGEPSSIVIVSENPRGQGFGKQARLCIKSKRFEPALDENGSPTRSTIAFNISFNR